ncbi:ImmA/IrrE family metallo-endopeptidase [Lysinibacillus telephonicus]|uniref:ImmA/IrrE family metallo-endopeptidase n=1 Tax=Lysinibacillus telephonicus TaxID=1714840 RepID=UPI0031FDD77D
MQIPSEVMVAGIVYKVDEVSGLHDKHELLGQILYVPCTIEINAESSKERKEQTFIHELTHAIFLEAGIEEQDEDMINRVGKVLYQVLKDNSFDFKS